MTKPITSVAAMMLHEQGKFRLDDPVADYIPSFTQATVLAPDGNPQNTVAPRRPITIRDILRHTTGYSYGRGDRERMHYEREGLVYHPPHRMMPPKMTIQEAAEALARVPALHHPGERHTYGFNTDLLGRLIEIWSGMALDKYLQQSVFDPLNMADTGFSVPKGKHDRFASCHTVQDGKLVIADKATSSPYCDGFRFLSGGGGLVSTVQDYANFCQMLLNGGVFEGRRLLKEETIKLMWTDQLNGTSGDFRFGLGFAVNKVKLGRGNAGRKTAQYSWGGYASTDFRLAPEADLFQIVMCQHVPYSNELANRLASIVYEGIE
jgi:CubicO group peptidase (beta-lactamase class C family)